MNISRPRSHWCKNWRICVKWGRWSTWAETLGIFPSPTKSTLNLTEPRGDLVLFTQKRTPASVVSKAVPVTVAWGTQILVCHHPLLPHCIFKVGIHRKFENPLSLQRKADAQPWDILAFFIYPCSIFVGIWLYSTGKFLVQMQNIGIIPSKHCKTPYHFLKLFG